MKPIDHTPVKTIVDNLPATRDQLFFVVGLPKHRVNHWINRLVSHGAIIYDARTARFNIRSRSRLNTPFNSKRKIKTPDIQSIYNYIRKHGPVKLYMIKRDLGSSKATMEKLHTLAEMNKVSTDANQQVWRANES